MSASPIQKYSVSKEPLTKLGKLKRQRQAALYDAVAGCVTTSGFNADNSAASRSYHVPVKNILPLPPEEVLFKRRDAPQRYQENDFYWADQNLPSNQSLPDSDLIKALHVYISEFYALATADEGQTDFRSMDETALLALSILLEEASKGILGKRGHLVFVEGDEEEQLSGRSGPGIDSHTGRPSMRRTSLAAQRSGETRSRKKMKLDAASDGSSEV
ncbi:hypothetical protein MMC11_003904 [Xylographa trunciseda]|nr:hypothetical protein [Xylographa trunciseda]